MVPADPELHAVRHAFGAAFLRMCQAETEDALAAELSNLLHHLFRLRELCVRRLGPGFYATAAASSDLRAAMGACWARNFDTHEVYAPADVSEDGYGDFYSDYYTALYGVVLWKPLAQLPRQQDPGHHREVDYVAELEGKPVLDTLRRAFDGLAGLL
jgi:hypothetical protein